jgi:hypothetical protein
VPYQVSTRALPCGASSLHIEVTSPVIRVLTSFLGRVLKRSSSQTKLFSTEEEAAGKAGKP